MEEMIMNKKVLVFLLAGILLLNGCANQNAKKNEKQVKDNVISQVQQDEKQSDKNKKQDEQSHEDQKSKTDVNDKEDNSSQNQKKTSKVSNNDSTTDKSLQSSNANKPSVPSQPDVEQPKPPVVEKEPETPKEEVKEIPVKQSSMSTSVMNQINNYRIQNGLQPLESTQYYQDKADAHALDMANKRALWHSENGECITNHPDPFNAWINSPEHREIILRENNTKGVVSIYYVDVYYYSVFQTSW